MQRERNGPARHFAGFVVAMFAVVPTAHAQSRLLTLDAALARHEVTAAMRDVDVNRQRSVERLVTIGSIVSPTGQEQDRAAEVARQMRAIGLEDVSVDALHDVVGVTPRSGGGSIVFVSTLDDLATVAEHQKAAGVLLRQASGTGA